MAASNDKFDATIEAMGAISVDGPSLFIWGTLLVFATDQHAAVRRASARGRRDRVRRPGRSTARHRSRARGIVEGHRAHRGLPAGDVRGRRDDAVRLLQRPADHVRRARGVLAAAVPALRAGASSPSDQPGSSDEVLPARSLLVGVLPVRHRADLRLRRLVRARRDRQRRVSPEWAPADCCWPASG